MMTYKEAQETFATVRDASKGKPLGNNTRLFKRGNDYAVRLHRTDVVLIHADGTYTLNNGGYYSRTSKDRINLYSPARVSQSKGNWYLNFDTLNQAGFFNGIRVNSNGKVIK